MGKFIVSTNEESKINYINDINGKKFIVLLKKDSHILDKIENFGFIFVEDMNKHALYLKFLNDVCNNTLIVFNSIKFTKHNSTIYNRIYKLCENSEVYVFNNLPFLFDYRNIFVPLKMIGIMKYHYKQWYDDNFYNEKGEKVNTLQNCFNEYGEYIITDSKYINYLIHDWKESEDELSYYNELKRRLIYENNYPKMKVFTWLTGEANRMESKLKKLFEVLDYDKKYLIITNWDTANKKIEQFNNNVMNKYNYDISCYSYHEEQPKDIDIYDEVMLFETIISQRYMFFEIVAKYIDKPLVLFRNNNIGVDKIRTNDTIETLKSMQEFYELFGSKKC